MPGFLWCALVAVVPVVVVSAAQDVRPTMCQVINTTFPGRVIFPKDTVYASAQSSYYSGEERDITPACIFMPTTASEVSLFVKTVTASKDKDALFAIRGGGHTLWSGAANIDGGITVDMRLINQTVPQREYRKLR